MKQRRENRKPTERARLNTYSDTAHARVDDGLARIGRTWHWLAQQLEDRGVATVATVTHWQRRRSRQVGCGVYLAALDAIDQEARCKALT